MMKGGGVLNGAQKGQSLSHNIAVGDTITSRAPNLQM